MRGCIKHLLSYRKKRRTLRHPAHIAIRARTQNDKKTTRSAILTCDTSSDYNVISKKLITDVLHEQYHPIGDASSLSSSAQRDIDGLDGYVYLDWRWESNKEEWHNSLFYITKTADPPYDAVLGRSDAEYYGLLATRRKA
ncbi:hypothetical protein IQ07DRAFT_208867 [Pyrenochaeta sp. DS3sAY3a]|nr:hypothetical protein IQ07DRAFT_208867 [Pyrenochaeta sp. DS3sAY3a]